MNKRKKVILMFLSIITLFFIISFTTDLSRTNKNNKPIFAIRTALAKDGGSERFTGLFYSVYHIKDLNEDKGYHLRTWFTSIEKVKSQIS